MPILQLISLFWTLRRHHVQFWINIAILTLRRSFMYSFAVNIDFLTLRSQFLKERGYLQSRYF